MNVVDHFAVDALLASGSKSLKRIGEILYRCDGTLNAEETDELAKLLAIVADENNRMREGLEAIYYEDVDSLDEAYYIAKEALR